MQTLSIDIPDQVLATRNKAELEALAREALAVRLYDLGELSSGEAAEMLSIPRREFLDLTGRYDVSVFDESDAPEPRVPLFASGDPHLARRVADEPHA